MSHFKAVFPVDLQITNYPITNQCYLRLGLEGLNKGTDADEQINVT
jgi:hypothetical protein